MNIKQRASLWLAFMFILMSIALWKPSGLWEIEKDLLKLLPEEQFSPEIIQAIEKVNNRYQREIVWSIRGLTSRKTTLASEQLLKKFNETDLISYTSSTPLTHDVLAIKNLLDDYRLQLLTPQDAKQITNAYPWLLHRIETHLNHQVESNKASNGNHLQALQEDPLGLFQRYMNDYWQIGNQLESDKKNNIRIKKTNPSP